MIRAVIVDDSAVRHEVPVMARDPLLPTAAPAGSSDSTIPEMDPHTWIGLDAARDETRRKE